MPVSLLLLFAAAPSASIDPTLSRMVALYDEICLRAFPDDKAVDTTMAAMNATRLTPDEVRVTFRDDPGRGWLLADGDRDIQVMLELPPYHACSVRRTVSSEFTDISPYRDLADKFQAAHPGYAPVKPMEADMDGRHIRAVGEQRVLANGGAETMYVFDQRVTDPNLRAAGQTGIDYRFVYQHASPDAR